MRLDGEVAIVTGAAQGLGRAFATALADEGALVTACDVKDAVHEIAGDRIHTEVANVSLVDCVRRVVDGTVDRHGRVDILVNNAGIIDPRPLEAPLDDVAAAFDRQVACNLRSSYLMGRHVLGGMMERGHGHVVNISTDHVLPGPGRPSPSRVPIDGYDASKWGLHGLTIGWANTARDSGVRVNAMCMGATDTPMLRNFLGAEPPEETVASWMRPEQTAAVLIDLLTEPDGRTGATVGLWVGHPVELRPHEEREVHV